MSSLTWDLTKLNDGAGDNFKRNLEELKKVTVKYNNAVKDTKQDTIDYLTSVLKISEEIEILSYKLYTYPSLISSTDVNNQEAILQTSSVTNVLSNIVGASVTFAKYVKKVNIKEVTSKSEYLKEYEFLLNNIKEDAKHCLSLKEETLYAKLRPLASGSWSDLQSLATANLVVNCSTFAS
jgi:oligoendopeptidase F